MSQAEKKVEGPKEDRAPLLARDAYDHFKTLQAMGLLNPADEARVKQYEEAERVKREEEEKKRADAQRRRETEMASAAQGELVTDAAARLARVHNAAEPAGESEEVDDTEALRKDLSQKIADHVYYLRAAGENWDTIVNSLAETFGLEAEEIRRTAKKKDPDAKIGQRLAATIIGQAQILGDASTD